MLDHCLLFDNETYGNIQVALIKKIYIYITIQCLAVNKYTMCLFV